ncbi:hypothetical protein [Mangrovibacter plantisponsor]|uniref:Uncharacterized protein n=1 Tax=Mangrovibacter plantisponsor TaxID=451513 RepID=A0A317PFF4_9ENTR|nr:hypothetical protein [Mangrovibacter plantisponsor]PWV98583.1 hypothetical protein DES37_1424 [Mangrovibacter plantisponsor]
MNMPLHDMPIEELIRTARSYATSMTPITTYTEIMHEPINRVDVLRVRGKVLANENAAIKCMNDCLAEELSGHQPADAEMHLIWQKCETPLTDDAIAALKAEAKSEVLDEMAKTYRGLANEDGCSCNMKSSYNLTAERAENYAAYIRRQLHQGGGQK